jgi:tetratricopeptide (TPR) repeat protein
MDRLHASPFLGAAALAALVRRRAAGTAQTPAADKPKAKRAAAPNRAGELSAELMYRLLVGDIALQRGDPALAARAYYEVAKEARDPRFARRATEIALAARQGRWRSTPPRCGRISSRRRIGRSRSSRNQGRRRLSRQRPERRARARARRSREGGPRLGEAFLELNRALASETDKAATLKLVQLLAQPYPDNAEAQFAVALAAYNAGLADFESTTVALQSIDRALTLKPRWEQAVLLKSRSWQQSMDRAADYLVEVLRTTPDAKPLQSALVQVRIQQKRYGERALHAAEAARERSRQPRVRVRPRDARDADEGLGEGREAARESERAGYGDDGVVESYLAQVAEETGRYELALERFKAVPDRRPRMVCAASRRSDAREAQSHRRGSPISRRPAGRHARAEDPGDSGDRAALSRRSQLQVRVRSLEKALAEYPDDPDLLYDAAMVAEKLDRIDIVEARLSRLVELKPSSAQALERARLYARRPYDAVAEGYALIQRALALSPDDPFILDSVGWAQFRLGKLDEAEKSLRQAMEQRPDPEIAAHLGEVLWAKGERALAQDVWQSQLKNAPDNAVLLETVRRLTR